MKRTLDSYFITSIAVDEFRKKPIEAADPSPSSQKQFDPNIEYICTYR